MFKFTSDDDRIAEAELLLREDDDESHDRSVLSSFYSGRPTMSEGEAAERGVAELTNHLFGFDALNMAKTQVESLYTKDPNIWEVHLKNVDEFDRQRLQLMATKKWNEIMKESQRFKGPWKGVAGDVTLFGQASLMWLSPVDWCPTLARPLIPRGTKASVDDVPYAFLPHYLTVAEMEKVIRTADELAGDGITTNWHIKELRRIVKMLTTNIGDKSDNYPSLENTPTEVLEQMGQNGSSPADHIRLKFPVFYCYERNSDGITFDMTIIARIKSSEKNLHRQNQTTVNVRLFHQKAYYPTARDMLCAFFLDCNIGGETMWHRVMGLGRLNYDNDMDVEEFFNEAMQGSKENVRRMYQVGSGANTDQIDRWVSDPAWSNLLPEGLNLVEAAKNPNFQYAFTVLEQLRQASKTNAGGDVSNTNDKQTNELEVQAIARQGRNAAAVSSRTNDMYDDLKGLGCTVWARFNNPEILSGDDGFAEIAEFQDYAKRELGLSPEFLSERTEHGKLINVEIKVVRSAGDGDRVREVMTNRMLMDRLQLFGPTAQKTIIRRVVASETQDPELAEALVPREQKIAFDQDVRANNENDKAMLKGINGAIPEISDEDADLAHLPIHLEGLAAAIAHGKAALETGGFWTMGMIEGFRALGAHAMQHIERISAIPEQRVTASQFVEQLQALSREADKLVGQTQQVLAERQQQDELSAKERADLELKSQDQQLKQRAQLKLEDHREDALNLSRRKQGFEESARDEQLQQSKSQQGLNRAVASNDAGRKERELEQKREQAEQQAKQKELTAQ